MDFIIGCNYWASNAGTEMWRQWNEEAIREDLRILRDHGIDHLRVFPNWRDFQPVEPVYQVSGRLLEYRLTGDRLPTNPWYLEEEMVARFSRFCELSEEYGMKLIVGLLAGFMSGRTFLPIALYGRDIFSDPTALYFQQKYITGLVKSLKRHKAIAGWDLGNECGGMGMVKDEYMADAWTAMIANAIRAADNTRPVVSGFNTLVPEPTCRKWTIRGQAENCDLLTTHPYAYFDRYTYKERLASFRTSNHATCECKFYKDLGGKPCLVEEIGTLGPMVAEEKRAADFVRMNLFSNWAHGASGVMWWCANEQTNLKTLPYTNQMCEVELGMIYGDRTPKPVLTETARIAKVLRELPFTLPAVQEDAICVLTQGQDQWGAAYMTWCLAKQAGMTLRFAYSTEPLPEASLYLFPSTSGRTIMPRERYLELKEKVRQGAAVYISNDDGIWAEFEEFTGMHVVDSGEYRDSLTAKLGDYTIPFARRIRTELSSAGAEVLARDSSGNPAVSAYDYGKGKVFYVNFPLETMLLEKSNAFDGDLHQVYRTLFRDVLPVKAVRTENPFVSLTWHDAGDGIGYFVAVNYSPESQDLNLEWNHAQLEEVYYGNLETLAPFEAVVFRVSL